MILTVMIMTSLSYKHNANNTVAVIFYAFGLLKAHTIIRTLIRMQIFRIMGLKSLVILQYSNELILSRFNHNSH